MSTCTTPRFIGKQSDLIFLLSVVDTVVDTVVFYMILLTWILRFVSGVIVAVLAGCMWLFDTSLFTLLSMLNLSVSCNLSVGGVFLVGVAGNVYGDVILLRPKLYL